MTLDAVLSEKSVARAAERLHVTPSAVSNALARLRLALGDPLVVRNGRGIVPTPRAVELAPALRSALDHLDRAIRSETFDAATTTRQFTIAVSDAGQISWLPAFGRMMSDRMPRAKLRMIGIDTYLAWGGPPSVEVDLAIAAIEDAALDVHITPLYNEKSVLVARRDHRWAGRRLTKHQLSMLQHVDVQVAPGRGYRQLAQLYAGLGIERSVALVVPSFVAAAAVVAETHFVATLPASLVDAFKTQFKLSALQAPVPALKTAVNLIWHARTNDDLAARTLRSLVTRSFEPPGGSRQMRP
nr:LysR substrate-binding domain-containing protein [Bradyrhizobium sp. Oc8]